MEEGVSSGLVVRVTGGDVWVDVDGDLVMAALRGKLRKRGRGSVVVAGDRVDVLPPEREGAHAAIESVAKRKSWLGRYIERENRERVIVANVDHLFVVAAIRSPEPHLGFIDRVLVSAAHGHVPASLILNKSDLAGPQEVEPLKQLYSRAGYQVIVTSAQSGDGVDEVAKEVNEGVYAFVGASGVGKSSLLMRIDPNLDLAVNEVGEKTRRGRHTTTNSQLYPFGSGYLADTPGVQTFGFPSDEKNELPDCFPEFAPFLSDCRFSPCSHSHEPDCGVKDAVENGDIARSRYESYTNILAEIEAREQRPGR